MVGGACEFLPGARFPKWGEREHIFGELFRDADLISVRADSIANGQYLPKLNPIPSTRAELGEPLPNPDRMECVTDEDAKYTYTFYANGVGYSFASAGEDAGSPLYFKLDSIAYRSLRDAQHEAMNSETVNRAYFPAWLRLMRVSKCEQLTITDGIDSLQIKTGELRFCGMFSELQDIQIAGDKAPTQFDPARMPVLKHKAELQFKNGVVYRLNTDGKKLWITSSDISYGLVYELKERDLPGDFSAMAKGRWNPPTGKPVIYLYPERPTEVLVKLDYQGRLIYTDPVYRDGWAVTAHPDGRLVNHADQKEYPYLFWEGDRRIDWDFSEGFLVEGKDVDAFLQEKLVTLGLIPAEYDEFIDYWAPEMRKNAYNLVTFSTEQYEGIAPLAITPAPDSLLRVHMVYKAVSTPVRIKEQRLPSFSRKGFCVVEWGGSRA